MSHADIIFHRLRLTGVPVGWSHGQWCTFLPFFFFFYQSHVFNYCGSARFQLVPWFNKDTKRQVKRVGQSAIVLGQLSDRGEFRTSAHTVVTLYLSVNLWHKQPAGGLGGPFERWARWGVWDHRAVPYQRVTPTLCLEKTSHNNKKDRAAGYCSVTVECVGTDV